MVIKNRVTLRSCFCFIALFLPCDKKYFFQRNPEYFCNAQGQQHRRVIIAPLNQAYRLARSAHQAAQFLLVHAKAGPQLFHPVLQRHSFSPFENFICHFDNYYCQNHHSIDNFICQ